MLRSNHRQRPFITAGVVALGVLTLAQLGGCAPVITRIEGGRLTVLTARALGVRPSYVITWGRRLEPDGTLIWHARGGDGIRSHGYICVLKRGDALPSCG